MIVFLLVELSREWKGRLQAALGDQALALEADSAAAALELLWSAPVGAVALSLPEVTAERLADYERLAAAAPQAVEICVAPAEVITQVRRERLLTPDHWLPEGASEAQVAEVIAAAVQQARLAQDSGSCAQRPEGPQAAPEPPPAGLTEPRLLQRLLAGLTSAVEVDSLLQACLEAVVEAVRPAACCLLWRRAEGEPLRVQAARGLPAAIVAQARLGPADALPGWYRSHSRMLTRSELSGWPQAQQAAELARELDLLRAQVAIPLLQEGRLRGLLLLGDRALPQPYTATELETLYLVSDRVSLHAQSLELHAQVRRSNAYLERILAGMQGGVITLGPDERIAVCNPYAAQALGLSPEQVQGQDLRYLPSPLGDYLYAALHSPQETVQGLQVELPGSGTTVRVTTSALRDAGGEPLGSVLLLEDMTAHMALAREQRRRERLDLLTDVVGAVAHEIRTPLTAIRTYGELAERSFTDPGLKDFWSDTVAPQIQRLGRLVEQLVYLVQQPEPDFVPVKPEELVQEAVRLLRETDPATEPVVEVITEQPGLTAIADAQATRDALVYVLRYLQGAGNSPVRVTVGRTENGSSGACISLQRVKRQEEQVPQEALFDPFRALETPGADLGPAISRKILAAQGVNLEAEMQQDRLVLRLIFPPNPLEHLAPAEVPPVRPPALTTSDQAHRQSG